MRLHEMHYLIRNTIDNWVVPDISERIANNQESPSYLCYNSQEILAILEPLRIIPSISTLVDKVYSCSEEFTTKKKVCLTSHGKEDLIFLMNQIYSNLSALLDMCKTLNLKQNSTGFDIKLPPNITLSELSECTNNLNNVFTQYQGVRNQ